MLGGRSRGRGEGEGGSGFAKALEYLHLNLQPWWSSRWTYSKFQSNVKSCEHPILAITILYSDSILRVHFFLVSRELDARVKTEQTTDKLLFPKEVGKESSRCLDID
ncbi:uncharacterized protein G2W53_029071 [Senna tora]|uniref:Uncharacterized protein n=1 Tax=Senna tora TaxID=362788 RepID=A0A834T710_9FABA|nr:uncharacterized protein G2W53_029071 [Senna tora]